MMNTASSSNSIRPLLFCLLVSASAFAPQTRSRPLLGPRIIVSPSHPQSFQQPESYLSRSIIARRISNISSSNERITKENKPTHGLFRSARRHLSQQRRRRARFASLWRWCSARTRPLRIVAATLAFWVACSSLHAPTATASTATVPATASARLVPSSNSLDTIIDRYVEQHMFDDDVGDTFESSFREAYDDATTRQYPNALTDVMGEEEQKKLLTSHRKRDLGQLLVAAARFVQSKTGLSENVVTIFFAGFVVIGAPFSLLMAFMVVNGISKRRMEQEFKQRYGESYSVDATLKPEDTVEAPPDEEEDDEDDDDDDDDDE